jgi:hypothetical protein
VSNVLIGIIGVILFIGLALAGALFLGPRFQESSNSSKAAASIQAVSQLAAAGNLYRIQEGRDYDSWSPTGLVGTYLKSAPSNPTSIDAPAPDYADAGGDRTSNVVARMAVMRVSGNATEICDTIAKQTGMAVANKAPVSSTWPTASVGCFIASGRIGVVDPGLAVAFARF